MEIPDGWAIAEDDRQIKAGEFFFRHPDGPIQRNAGLGLAQQTPAFIKANVFELKDAVFLKPVITEGHYGDMEIPNGWELVTEDDYICQSGEIFSVDINYNQFNRVAGYRGYTWAKMKKEGIKALLRYRQKPLTPEERERRQIRKSQEFVKKYIKNPNYEDYQKYEKVFLREDDFGL